MKSKSKSKWVTVESLSRRYFFMTQGHLMPDVMLQQHCSMRLPKDKRPKAIVSYLLRAILLPHPDRKKQRQP